MHKINWSNLSLNPNIFELDKTQLTHEIEIQVQKINNINLSSYSCYIL